MAATSKNTAKKILITPEIFTRKVNELIGKSLKSVLFQYQISFKIEKDPEMKKKRLAAWVQTQKDIGQVEAVLSIAAKHDIDKVFVKTAEGKIFDCSLVKPRELGEDSVSNLLVELSKTMK
ncbi:hypothetical protein [Draconibacterium sediminis]|uniref:Uncharacterized protein n=1 Tax=Draconibacterium sediminis TaxID=1544798 RepID=A0A0D8JC07_9BACT|nr:hypothetical protein [Draconibacterium sediminis]KJF44061.1 hypothetical protein LH29_00535 [Draconibacterium sediminis]